MDSGVYKNPNIKRSTLDNYNRPDLPTTNFTFDNEKINHDFVTHANQFHSFGLGHGDHDGIDMDYIFILNYYDSRVGKRK
jgi:hypothetical protein